MKTSTKVITQTLLNETTQKAQASNRFRMNYNFHEDLNEPIHRMLNAMEPDTYIRPHKHDKLEAVVILRGKMLSIIFDEEGNITQKVELSPEGENIGIEIPRETYHAVVVLEPGTIIYEVKEGPYIPLDENNFAQWSPDGSNQEDVKEYIEKLL